MFNDRYGLTDAVLCGRKTMTRRIVSIPDTWHGIDVYAMGPDTDNRLLLLYDADEFLIEDYNTGLCGQVMPLYKVGEEVAIAQSYKDISHEAGISTPSWLVAKAGWTNKMFVRAELMPHLIRITDIRVERLQDIGGRDFFREGIYSVPAKEVMYSFDGCLKNFPTPREAFAALINKVSGKGTWDSNPYVFVYSFELIK